MGSSELSLLNIGCGGRFHPRWINLDLHATPGSPVIAWDLRRGIPYGERVFHGCYASHILEHMRPQEAHSLLGHIRRVLRHDGVLRVVVPDLEGLARAYLDALNRALSGNDEAAQDHEWMVIELFDQVARCWSGGEMAETLQSGHLKNTDFILRRIGNEAMSHWSGRRTEKTSFVSAIRRMGVKRAASKARELLLARLAGLLGGRSSREAFEIGTFRQSGEIHHTMYDRFSLSRLLEQVGFRDPRVVSATESRIPNFAGYELDSSKGVVLKPDSLFMEAVR